MHKLIEYVCDELEELEKKADKGGLSASEIQYADTLAHLKKNLLKGEEEYSSRYTMDGTSYARGRRRDSMGRYSRSTGDMVDRLHDMAHDAPTERIKREIEKFADKVEQM